jgi:uncharacterized membrane protein
LNHFEPVPTALYGVDLLFCALAYTILQTAILARPCANKKLASAVGSDLKGKISLALYCEDESHCHRGMLRSLLVERGAAVA